MAAIVMGSHFSEMSADLDRAQSSFAQMQFSTVRRYLARVISNAAQTLVYVEDCGLAMKQARQNNASEVVASK